MYEIKEVTVDQRSYRSIEPAMREAQNIVYRVFAKADAVAAKILKDYLVRAYQNLRRRHNARWFRAGLFGPQARNTRLYLRSGRGLMSIRQSIDVKTTAGGVEASISTGDMGIHETGGTIRPTGHKYIAIPTVFAMDASGKERQRGPRSYSKSFIGRSKSGSVFVFRRERNGRIVPLYLLKKKVKIAARLGLGETLDRGLDRLAQEMGDAVEGK